MKKKEKTNLKFLIIGMVISIIISIFFKNNLLILIGMCIMSLSINGFKLSEKTYFITGIVPLALLSIWIFLRGWGLNIIPYLSNEMIIISATPFVLSIATIINRLKVKKLKVKKINASTIITLCLSILILIFLAYAVKINGMHTICEYY